MGYDDFGLKIGLEGEKEFKKALSEINQSFKVLGSEMKVVQSQFDKNDNSVEALTARNQVLNKEIEAQKQKIETLRQALANASESFGENDRRTQQWQIQLNNATAALNDMERELDRNNAALDDAEHEMDDVADSADDLEEELDDAGDAADDSEGKFSKLGGTLKTVGIAMGAVVTAAAAAAVSLGKAVVEAYGEYEQLVGGIDTLFKDSSASLQEYANNAYKTAGMSANDYMSTVTSFSASLISSLGGDTEAAVKYADMAITDMADNANKMGTDIGLIQNAYQGFAKQNYTMLDNLKLGYGGTKTEMERLLADALDGKIDLIVTKSVSRFARNTVDSLVTIRKLKENGVECYFEKEGIYTFDGKGELLITIMSSLAQEESRNISENITWGQRKSFSDGKVHLPYKRFLGYEKGEDGRPAVVESEARVVKLIYGLFLESKTQAGICKYLEELGIPSPGGKQTWSKTTITSILQNEKYKGDALLRKKFTVDFLEKKMKPNEGEVPQYYVTGSHPAIIEPDEWEQVQAEFARRKTLGKAYSGKSVLSAKLVCEDCGAFFGPKVWHSTDQYRRTIWQCNGKFANEERCHTPVVDTETIQRLFIKAYNLMMQDRVQIIKQCEAWRARLMDFGTLDTDIERQLEETQVVAELVKAAVKENASTAQSQEAYLKKYEALTERYEKAAAELERLQSLRTARSQQDKKMALYIRTLKKQPEVMHDWNDTIWTVMIEKAIVHKDGQITFVFQNGTEIKVGA